MSNMPHPVWIELEAGPPAMWVSRFGLPSQGVLLDSGLDDHAQYVQFDALALTPSKILDYPSRCIHDSHQGEDLYQQLEEWSSSPWQDCFGQEIKADQWEKVRSEIGLPIPLVMCALSYELGAERAGISIADVKHSASCLWAARYSAVYLWCRKRRRGFVVGESQEALTRLKTMLTEPLLEQHSSGEHPLARASHNPWLTQGEKLIQGELRPHIGWPTYRSALHEIHELLLSGDLYQLNFTLGMSARLCEGTTPEEVFTRLHSVNSGQFGAFFRLDEHRSIISLSPERLVRWGENHPQINRRLIETAPIKGTRPRKADPQQDLQEREALKASGKDQAEHVMILDLERNDLGKICESGSVEVIVDREIHSYTTVHHMVSVVRGALKPEITLTNILEAIFPGGSVTGAPKLRSMQAIRMLESGPRGIYCGALGYLEPHGGGDLNLPIRTVLIDKDRLTYHAGGGIVAESTAQGEWEEVWVKTQGILKGLGATKR